MKAVICAAGKGSRLAPLTNVAPKCLLPVYNQPMIMYPLSAIKQAGITDVCIVVSPEHAHLFATLLADGSELGLNISFKIQKEALGVCDAIALTEDFVSGDDFMVMLGDNVMFDDLSDAVSNFKGGANLLLTEVSDPRPFGVAKFENEKLVQLLEKPQIHHQTWYGSVVLCLTLSFLRTLVIYSCHLEVNMKQTMLFKNISSKTMRTLLLWNINGLMLEAMRL